MKKIIFTAGFLLIIDLFLLGQTGSSGTAVTSSEPKFRFGGFVRGGFYSWIDNTDDNPYISSAFSDIGLHLDPLSSGNIRAYADIRFRYGSEFQKPVSRFDIREAWVGLSYNKWDISIGQKIIKWGRCDFSNPTSRLSPMNTVLRSPDREDMDMSNLLASLNFYPAKNINLEAVLVPFYRPSVLIIDPFPLPQYVVINKLPALLTNKEMFSYGLKSDFHFRMIDWSISWFDGYDPMPGVALTYFSIDNSQPIPLPYIELSMKPYRNRVAGIDFETVIGTVGVRGEAAWSNPELKYNSHEYVPMPEINWVAGADWSARNFRFTAEYNGKYIIDFSPSTADPYFGTEPDYSALAELMGTPGFNLEDYVRQQIGAFNRLYNNQLKKQYHSLGLRVEADILYGRFLPSLFSIYNFSSRNLLLIPELEIKPADAFYVKVGAEIYKGPDGSLYELIDDFMNGIYVSLRFDF